MDAANLSFNKIALSFALALLIPAAASAQPSFLPSSNSVVITGQSGQVAVNSSGAPITFSATPATGNVGDNWLCVNNGLANQTVPSLSTPATLTLSVCGGDPRVTAKTATVTLHATDISGAADTSIAVSYTVGSGGGGGGSSSIVSSPSSVTQSVTTGSQVQTSVSLSTTSASGVGFTLAAPSVSWVTWAQSAGTTGQVSSSSPATIAINLNAAGQAQGTLTTTLVVNVAGGTSLNIPVTFNNGTSGGGGSGGTGSLNITPTTVNWTYSSSSPSTFPASVPLFLTTTNQNVIDYTATAITSNGWMIINTGPAYSGQMSASFPPGLTLSPTTNIASLATGSYTGTLSISASDGSTAMVTVNLSVNGAGGGGGGTLTISPNPITLSGATTNGPNVSTIVTVTSSVAGTVTPSLAGTGLSFLSGQTQNVAAGGSVNFTILGNPTGLSNSTYSGTFAASIPGVPTASATVNFVVGSGGGGSGAVTISPNPITVSAPLNGNATQTSITVNSTVSGTIQASLSGTGLTLFGSGQTITAGTPVTLTIQANPFGLANTTYSGTLSVTVGSSFTSAQVSFVVGSGGGGGNGVVTINPSPVSLSANANGDPTQTAVTVTSSVGGALTASLTGTGLSFISGQQQNVTAGVPVTIFIYGNPSGLSNNTYTGTLTVTVAGNISTAQVNFVIGSGGGGGGTATTVGAAPSQLSFVYEMNTSMSSFQSQQVYLGNTGTASINVSTTTGSNWLTTSSASSSLPATINVFANALGLAAGTYTGTVSVTNSSTGTVSTVNVTLVVTGVTVVYSNPGDLIANYTGGSSPLAQSQFVTVSSSDGSVVPVSATVANAASAQWLTVTPGSTTTPLSLTVATNATNLANGVYTASISVTGGNVPLNIPVVLVVTGSSSSGNGPLTISESALTLPAQVNGSSVTHTVTVSAATQTSLTISSQGSSNGVNWLSVSPSGSATTPVTLTITASPAGLIAGNYTGTISLTANGTTQTIQVILAVGSTSGATVTVSANGAAATSLTFNASSLGQTLPTQVLNVSSPSGQSAVSFTAAATTTNGGSWIQLNTATGSTYLTPLNVNVTANTTGLAAGTYNGQVTITPVGGTAVNIPVTLTITGAPSVGVSTSSLTFSYQAGGATPNTQTIPVTVSGASTAGFTATAASTPSGWLVVTPTSGTAPSSVTASINPAGLSAGTYTGTITVAGSGGTTGTATVNVTLTVTVPLPTITAVVNAASFASGPISPGEIITIGGTSIGPATPVNYTLDSTGKFFTTTLGGVQVLINGYAAPLIYVSANQINCVAPYEIAGILSPTVLVKFLGQSSNGFTVNMAAAAPGIFTLNGSGSGPGAILNGDNSVNASTPAAKGSVVQVFLTGEGQTTPGGVDGKITTAPYPSPLLKIAITVGGQPADFQFAGEAPGLISGLMQLNVVIPTSLTATGNLPLSVAIGSAASQSGVTVNVK